MADVEFNEPTYASRAPSVQSGSSSSLSRLVIKMKLAKDERSAQMVLLGIAVVAIIAMLFVLFSGGGKPTPIEPTMMVPGQTAP